MIFLYIILCLIVAVLVLAFFQGDEFTITSEQVINKPVNEVYEFLRLLRNSEHFNKWVMQDPNMKKEFTGTDGTVGFVYSWDSQMGSVGKGAQEIKALEPGHKISYEIRFEKPFKGVSTSELITEAQGNHTLVKMVFFSKKNFMMKLMHMVLNLAKVLQKDMAISLTNLKNKLEQQ